MLVIFARSSILRYDSSEKFTVLPCFCNFYDLKIENKFIKPRDYFTSGKIPKKSWKKLYVIVFFVKTYTDVFEYN